MGYTGLPYGAVIGGNSVGIDTTSKDSAKMLLMYPATEIPATTDFTGLCGSSKTCAALWSESDGLHWAYNGSESILNTGSSLTLQNAYDSGQTIGLASGVMALTDTTTAAANAVTISKTGASNSGKTLVVSNTGTSNTGEALEVTSTATGVALKVTAGTSEVQALAVDGILTYGEIAQAISTSVAPNVTTNVSTIALGSGGTLTGSMPACTLALVGFKKTLVVVSGTGTYTLSPTSSNILGASTSIVLDAIGDSVTLIGVLVTGTTYKWAVYGQNAVAIS